MRDFARPVLVISRCLELAPVRYNGQVIPFRLVKLLEPRVDFVPVCPEVEIGLGVPRDPIRIVVEKGEARLVQPSTERDLTREMQTFSSAFLDSLEEVDGFILKSRSPSCGIKDVKAYASADAGAVPVEKRAGFFAAAVRTRFPGIALEDEGRLLNYEIREHFLTRLFASAALRQVRASGSMAELVRFQAEHKLLLMAHNQQAMRTLGRLVANRERRPFEAVAAAYAGSFQHALARAPRRPSNINALLHALGYVSAGLKQAEKAFFLDLLGKYRERRIPLSPLLSVLRSWILRFEVPYLEAQSFLEPYPEELISAIDSGKK